MSVPDRARDVVPFLDLAVHQFRSNVAAGNVVDDPSSIVGLDLTQDEQGSARHADIDQRLLATCAKASQSGQEKVGAAALDCLDEGVIETLSSVAAAAGSHADADARNRRHEFVQPSFADRIEYANVFNSRHHSLSRSNARTSRCSVRSLTCPQIGG